MRVLIVGGTRFLGIELALVSLAAGHTVTLLNRGTQRDPFGVASARIEQLHADRTTRAFDDALAGRTFDAAIDFAAYTRDDAASAVRVLEGRVGHYVFISTGQVYLVRDGYTWPAREGDYDGPLMPEPSAEKDRAEWRYGIDKRAAEDVLKEAWSARAFPATRLRLPMVIGARDHYRRLESYVVRLLDGGALLVPDGGLAPARHVYARAVTRTIGALLGDASTFGQAFNLAQDEVPTVSELIASIARQLGAAPQLVAVPRERLARAGLDATSVSPFSNTWMSCINPSRAKHALRFRHEPLAEYLPATLSAILASLPADAPPGYASRAAELALAREMLRSDP